MREEGAVTVGDGAVWFGLEYRDLKSDQVLGDVDGEEVELLRFDCFDHQPHYHYGPRKRNERLMLDQTTEGDPLEWTLQQLARRLPAMVERAGYEDLARGIEVESMGATLEELRAEARRMALEQRRTVCHGRGDVVLEAGPVRFDMEFRHLSADQGVAIHVLGDVGDEEVELLTFDCFDNAPHYHYGPRADNQRLYLDKTTVPDPLRWALDLFKGGKPASMLERAGYRDHAARLNPTLLAEKVVELESVALEMRAANAQ